MDRDHKLKELDSFWDISELVPKVKQRDQRIRSIEPIDISSEKKNTVNPSDPNTDQTVIKRYITPHGDDARLTKNTVYLSETTYSPTGSLIHSVTLKRIKPSYNYYSGFMANAIEYMNVKGYACEYVPFFSYVPQYDQMNESQRSYYFWFRENSRLGSRIKTDYGYLFLYVYELINLGDRLDVRETQGILASLWNNYNEEFPAISSKLAVWICEYSLLHHLPPPMNISGGIIQNTSCLKEFYIDLPKDDLISCARSLIKYCSSYDFRKSTFYKEETATLFDNYIVGAVIEAIKYYSGDGEILSKLTFGDSSMERDAFVGAVCTAELRYRIKVNYCSFSRSNELRFLIGDIMKYAENKLRAYLGIKSRMTVYSVSVELKKILDEYFSASLPSKRISKVKEEKHDYDKLYDVPKRELSLSNAARIECESWETTRELVEAFDNDANEKNSTVVEPETVLPVIDVGDILTVSKEEKEFNEIFGDLWIPIVSLLNGDKCAIIRFAAENGRFSDAVVDEINELAIGAVGDSLVEDDGEGKHQIIEDYKYLFDGYGECL